MIRRLSLVLSTVLLLTSLSAAQSAMSDSKRALIGELILVMKLEENTRKITDVLLDGMQKNYPIGYDQAVDSNPNLTPQDRAQLKKGSAESFNRFSTKFRGLVATRVDYKKYIEDAVYPLYYKFYTETELTEILAFYKTKTGAKVIDTMPQLFAESQRLATEFLVPQLLPLVTEIMEEEFKEIRTTKRPARSGSPRSK